MAGTSMGDGNHLTPTMLIIETGIQLLLSKARRHIKEPIDRYGVH